MRPYVGQHVYIHDGIEDWMFGANAIIHEINVDGSEYVCVTLNGTPQPYVYIPEAYDVITVNKKQAIHQMLLGEE